MNKAAFSTEELRIIREVGRGGEGVVYEVTTRAGQRLAYKRYHDEILTRRGAQLEQKLRAMIGHPPAKRVSKSGHLALLWPTATVADDGSFRGFCMPLLSGEHVKLVSIVDARARRKSGREHWTWGARLVICHNLAIALSTLHQVGAAYGDLNEENAVVDQDGLVTLLDLDSISLRAEDGKEYLGSGVTRDDWMPPEYAFDPTYTQDGDAWALAVQIYMLLMESTRPYSVAGQGLTPKAAVQSGHFPIVNRSLAPPSSSPPLDLLPSQLQVLFQAAFGEGRQHPSRRPRPSEYARELEATLKSLKTCSIVPSHMWAGSRNTCPWCERNLQLSPVNLEPQTQMAIPPPVLAKEANPTTRVQSTPISAGPGSNAVRPRPAHRKPRGCLGKALLALGVGVVLLLVLLLVVVVALFVLVASMG